MKLSGLVSFLAWSCFAMAHAAHLTKTELLKSYNFTDDATGATAFALLYGAPFLSFAQSFGGSQGLKAFQTNTIRSAGTLANAASKFIKAPNADTLYGLAVIDLAKQDLVVKLPPVDKDRYYLLAFYDPYGDQYSSLGSVHGSQPGDYLLHASPLAPKHGANQSTSCDAAYKGCITSPTYQGLFLARVLVRNNGTDEQHAASVVKNITLTPTNQRSSAIPSLTPSDLDNLSNDTSTRILELTARLGYRNLPETTDYVRLVPKILHEAGIGNGTYSKPHSVNMTAAETMYNNAKLSFLTSPNSYVKQDNGWQVLNPETAGTWHNGTDLVSRTAIALRAYLANTAEDAIYPTLAAPQFSLNSNESYLFTFSSKPPVAKDGFWSITAYDSDGYLIENPLNVYQVGDRSNLTYSNGSLVYPTVDHSSDGKDIKPFQVLIQPSNVMPPKNWTHNWLPSPNDTETFSLIFRMYAPHENAYNGSWSYPKITKQAALVSPSFPNSG